MNDIIKIRTTYVKDEDGKWVIEGKKEKNDVSYFFVRIRDDSPLFSGKHPQWLWPRGKHAKKGDLVVKLWKRYYRPAEAWDTKNIYIADYVDDSGGVLTKEGS